MCHNKGGKVMKSHEEKEGPKLGPVVPLARWEDYYLHPTKGAMKSFAHHRQTNGFSCCYILIKKKAYIDLEKFWAWMRSHIKHEE